MATPEPTHSRCRTSVAVIIPVRNRRKLLQRALQSVIDQHYSASEIIVVDDGSDDQSGASAKQAFPQIELLVDSPQGVSHARNLGIERARSTWIALLDSDDMWHPDKLERQMALIEQQGSARVVHCDEIWMRNNRRVNPKRKHAKPQGNIYKQCLPLCCMSPSATLIHHSVFDDIGLFDESMPACEDYDLWLRIASQYPVFFVNEKLLTRFAGHTDQLSACVPAQDRYRLRSLEKMLSGAGLAVDDWMATLAMFATKVAIFANGAQKRGRVDEACHWRQRLRHFESLSPVERTDPENHPELDQSRTAQTCRV